MSPAFYYLLVYDSGNAIRIISRPLGLVDAQRALREFESAGATGGEIIAISAKAAQAVANQQAAMYCGQFLAFGYAAYKAPPVVRDDYPRCLLSIGWWSRKVASFLIFWIGGPLETKEYRKWHG